MAKRKHEKAVNRFGVRYGKTNKSRLAKVESLSKGKQKCPYCSYTKVRRSAVGIYVCEKCETKFAGRAYSLTTDKRQEASL